MKVRFYGKLVDVFGREQDLTLAPPCTVAEVRGRLLAEHPGGAALLQNERVRACVGDTFAQDGDLVPDGAVVEFLAPLSGG